MQDMLREAVSTVKSCLNGFPALFGKEEPPTGYYCSYCYVRSRAKNCYRHYCSHINSNSQLRGHRTGSRHSGGECGIQQYVFHTPLQSVWLNVMRIPRYMWDFRLFSRTTFVISLDSVFLPCARVYVVWYFIKNILRTSAVSSTNFRSILIFASCVVGTCNILRSTI